MPRANGVVARQCEFFAGGLAGDDSNTASWLASSPSPKSKASFHAFLNVRHSEERSRLDPEHVAPAVITELV